MKTLLFFWWRLCPSMQVRIYYRMMRFVADNRNPSSQIEKFLLFTPWKQMTKLEQEFLRWRGCDYDILEPHLGGKHDPRHDPREVSTEGKG